MDSKKNSYEKNKKSLSNRFQNLAHTLPLEGKGSIPSDVNGSYTGTPLDGGVPVQDADDL